MGDLILIERLAANLIDNAIRYNKPDGTVQTETRPHDRMAVFRITNTGPLISPDQIDDHASPFTRIQQRIGSEGHCLGLRLAKSIAKAHGGNVTAVPCPDGEMEICVELPLDCPVFEG